MAAISATELIRLLGLTVEQLNFLNNLTTAELELLDSSNNIGTVGSPASGTITATEQRIGNFVTTTLTLVSAAVPMTDSGGATGGYGALKIYDFPEAGLLINGCKQNYTAFAVDGTNIPDNASFGMGVGSAPITAANSGALLDDEDDIGTGIAISLTGGTGTGTNTYVAALPLDGTTTASDSYLNISIGDASISDDDNIAVTGTVVINWVNLGDD